MEKSSGGGGGTALINLSFCSTNMLCSDWGQSDRRTKPSPPPHLPRTPSPPPSLTQHTMWLVYFFFFPPVSWEKTSALEGLQTGAIQPFFTCTISTGVAGGYRGDPSTATHSRWPACHCHLSPENLCLCHTRLWVQPRMAKNNVANNFIKWCQGFLATYLGDTWHARHSCLVLLLVVVERRIAIPAFLTLQPGTWKKSKHKHSWVWLMQPDWMGARWTPSEGNETSIIQQKRMEEICDKNYSR